MLLTPPLIRPPGVTNAVELPTVEVPNSTNVAALVGSVSVPTLTSDPTGITLTPEMSVNQRALVDEAERARVLEKAVLQATARRADTRYFIMGLFVIADFVIANVFF